MKSSPFKNRCSLIAGGGNLKKIVPLIVNRYFINLVTLAVDPLMLKESNENYFSPFIRYFRLFFNVKNVIIWVTMLFPYDDVS